MQLKTSLLVAFCAGLLLPACSNTQPVATPPVQGSTIQSNEAAVYQQRGMEISSITSQMADTLQQNLFYYLLPDAPIDRSSDSGNVKIVTMPRVAITSFVDTDTYENAGYLGRALAEFFTHELSERAFEVTEYKVTGRLAVGRDGDFILSRNWKKIASDTKVKFLVGGTLTRNDAGVVVIARIINMQTRQVIASSTGFIPYNLLPYCYRTAEKNCSFTGTRDYLEPQEIRDAKYYKSRYEEAQSKLSALEADAFKKNAAASALTKAKVVSASGKPLGGVFMAPSMPPAQPAPVAAPANAQGVPSASTNVTPTTFGPKPTSYYKDPRFNDGTVVGATSRGNYDEFIKQKTEDKNLLDRCFGGNCIDPVVYPSNTYMHNTLLIRDSADESGYSRIAK